MDGMAGGCRELANGQTHDRLDTYGECRELAHGQTHDRLDTYGECRDSHELLCSEVTRAWTGWQSG